jgi:LytS/YehU family sensor histidine kinase
MLWVRMSAVEALVLALAFWGSVLLTLTSAWLTPDQFVWSGRMNWGKWTKGALAGVLGMLVGLLVSSAVSGDLGQLLDGQRLLNAFWRGLPWMIGALAVMGLITGAVAHLSRWRLQIQVRSLRLAAERDAAARDAAEARLKLLQAQIRPHFIFNTLSALQHWVDQADPRGAPLLRSLTAFLRGSTDTMGRDAVPLGHEMTMVGHYLDIMKARLGDRLHCVVDPPAAHVHDLMLPPGLVLTLVENAIEHGLEPKIEGGTLRLSSGCSDRAGHGQGGWWLRVEDDGLGLSPQDRDQVGLSNLRQRLQQHYGSRARFTLQALATGGTRAELHFEEAACPAS